MPIYLSYPLDPADPRPPAIPAPELIPLYTIEKNGASVHTLKIASHTGTHVDTPAHVIAGGIPLEAFSPDEFVFTRPVVVDIQAADDEIIQPDQLAVHGQVIRGNEAPLVTGWDGYHAYELNVSTLLAVKRGDTVTLPLDPVAADAQRREVVDYGDRK